MLRLLARLFPSLNTRTLRRYARTAARIAALEPAMQALSNEQLRAKTDEFKAALAQGKTAQDILVEAFAVVREAAWRRLGLRAFDVQVIGAIALHEGRVAEMRTGEGKTLVAVFAAYLGALSGRGVHVVTVNEYLAMRDARKMSRVYGFLGLSTGVNLAQLDAGVKRTVYACDVTYGTNNEFAFDYLRDNMALDVSQRVQRTLHYAIVDEADSILIDEARTPLIVSGQSSEAAELYLKLNSIVPLLKRQIGQEIAAKLGKPAVLPEIPGDFYVDEEDRQVYLTEAGHARAEHLLEDQGLLPHGASLYDPVHAPKLFHLLAALKAHFLYKRDEHYVVQGTEVVIVDDFTGRLQPGRQWSDGLHQAVEAKEGVPIRPENLTLASITFQKYFTLYDRLAGMTGTAATDAQELAEVYRLGVVVIPPNRQVQRKDAHDAVYAKASERDAAVVQDILECVRRKQPVLVGTTSIQASEKLSALLKGHGVAHEVLNAKQHAREALIVSQAGMPGAVTIATNMAGRGTDIVLGGSIDAERDQIAADASLAEEARRVKLQELASAWQRRREVVFAAGGLRVIGVERSESRRIDNQLRGRAGRQGDPGSSQFYLSLDDPLLQIFAADRMKAVMKKFKVFAGQPIRSSMLSRVIAGAQRKIEGSNFERRKELLVYDNVANEQRTVVYAQRRRILETDNQEQADMLREGALRDVVRRFVPDRSMEEQWDLPGLERELALEFSLPVELSSWVQGSDHMESRGVQDRVVGLAAKRYAYGRGKAGEVSMRTFEKTILLQILDRHWREHLTSMEDLRKGIHLQQHAQQDPKLIYRHKAFTLFEGMLQRVRSDFAKTVFWEITRLEQLLASQEVAAVSEVAQDGRAPAAEEAHAAEPRVLDSSDPDFDVVEP